MKKLFTGKKAWITYTILALLIGGCLYYYYKIYLPAKEAEDTGVDEGDLNTGTGTKNNQTSNAGNPIAGSSATSTNNT